MSQWSVMAPNASMVFTGEEDSLTSFYDAIEKIAGVKQRQGRWTVPLNAVQIVAEKAVAFGVEIPAAQWVVSPAEEKSWADIEALLQQEGEVQGWALGQFPTVYQKEAIAFAWNRFGVHFWHPTGSGKTYTGIICSLSVPGPVIVVTRAASRLQYAREIERFLNVRAHVLRPASAHTKILVNGESWNEFRSRHKGQGFSTKQMGQLWANHQKTHGVDPPKGVQHYLDNIEHRPFIVVAWEALRDNVDLLCGLRPGCVIYDESHRGKNSKRWDVVHLADLSEDEKEAAKEQVADDRAARRKGGFVKDTEEGRKMFLPVLNTASCAAKLARASTKRLCTTATPIKDRVRDLWAQLDLSEPNAWGNTTTWMNRYADRKPGVYGGFDTTGSSNLEELNLRLKSVAHILDYRDTHRHLPAKRRQSVYILPEDQCRPSAGFPAELREAQKRGAGAVLEVRLAQAASKKRKAVAGMIEDHISSNHKLVVFTGRKRDCDELGELVRKLPAVKRNSATVWSAHGSQSTDHRQSIIDDYMAHPGPCILVGTGHAFGESLNIHDTDAALFVMLPYTPGQLRQWEGRFARLGQKRPVVIYYVIAEDTVDEHIASILIDKLPAVQRIVQDAELAEAGDVLAGIDTDETDEEFMVSILALLDF